MFHSKSEVVVVGAGPVGLFAALALARRGIRVEIVDARWRLGPYTHDVLALHPGSLELFEDHALAQSVLERALRVETIGVYDHGERHAELALSELRSAFPFVAILPPGDLETRLIEALGRQKVHVEWNHRLSRVSPGTDHAAVTIDTLVTETAGYATPRSEVVIDKSRDLEPAFVLAADGPESLIRRQLEIAFDPAQPGERYAIFEIEFEEPVPTEIRILLGDRTRDVVWPMPGGGWRFMFQLVDDDAELDAATVDDPTMARALLDRLVAERAPWFSSDVTAVRSSLLADCEHRLARSFGEGHVWLAGDAGHTTDWAAAQSMNVGLREAADLARIYSDVIHENASEAELSDYARDRRDEWLGLFGAAGHAPIVAATAAPWVSRHAARLGQSIPASGDHLFRLLEPLGIQIPH